MTKNIVDTDWRMDARTKRNALASDPHRPRYHFAAPAGWMNDPNGLMQWQGQYHLFYQHNPLEAKWGPPHWGHAVSEDLVRWRDLPVALTPETPPVNRGGCWSGCAVVADGTPTFVYTGVRDEPTGEQTTCLAFGDPSDPLLKTWRKFEGNPVMGTPSDLGITQKSYRDPYVWQEDGSWYQVIGTSLGDTGQVLLYRSPDLKTWDYLGPLMPPELRATYPDASHTWECPNFFKLGERWVLIVSLATPKALAYPVAFIGDYRDHQFYPEVVQRLDWGYHCFYAPLTMRDDGGRRLMWGWLQEHRSAEAQLQAGWSGIMSLPRVLTVKHNRLISTPAEEVETLRQKRHIFESVELSEGLTMLDIRGRALELNLNLHLGEANEVGIVLALAEDESEGLYLLYNRERGELRLEPRGPEVEQGAWTEDYSCPIELEEGGLELRVFLDGSAIEVFAQDKCLTGRVYGAKSSERVALYADGRAKVEKFEIWETALIW